MTKHLWIYLTVTLCILILVTAHPEPQTQRFGMPSTRQRAPPSRHTAAQEGGEGGEGNGHGGGKAGKPQKSGPVLNVGFNLDLGEIFQKLLEKLGQAFGVLGELKNNLFGKEKKEKG